MPIVDHASFKTPFYLFNRHLETIVPNAFRNAPALPYSREKLKTSDGDFLDLDWIRGGFKRLAILTHGLEGNSERLYIRGMARLFFQNGWDILAWNCRSCGGRLNDTVKLYHHGDTDDLREVVDHVGALKTYESAALIGFSMGASMSLKYLSVVSEAPSFIKGAAAISAPCNLRDSAREAQRPANRIYFRKFFGSLLKKLKQKADKLPELAAKLHLIKTFDDIHKYYTSLVYGFKDAADFYYHASVENFVDQIQRPALIINAQNDPIIPDSCSPVAIAKNHPLLFLERPRRGGHVGFAQSGQNFTWAELRSLQFLSEI